ncbi:MAG: class I SAM-dependent methyltransferase [Planctomycetes bacterium]|nr:class I SAM-dependent methyltransferase [Planctomycetota bacterium]
MLELLRELYAQAPSGFDAPLDDRLAVERAAGEGAQAYGELREGEALRLLRWLRLGPQDALFDLGAGTGKLVLWAAATTRVGLAVGVELSRHHHEVARGVLERLLAALPAAEAAGLRARVRLVQGDLRAVDLTPATVVYACANCFPDAVRAHVAEQAHAAPRLRALLTTRPPPSPWPERLEELGRARVLTTWSESERVFVYVRRGSQAPRRGRGPPCA